MKKTKVLHVTYDMRIGGTEMVIKNIIEGSDKELLDMSIFCIEEPLGPWGEEMRENGIAIHSQNRKDGFDTSLISGIRKVIKEQSIDVLHCHQYTPWVYGVLAAVGLRTKVIFTEHGRFYPDSSSWKRRFINPVLAFFTDHITAISKATKQALVEFEFLNEKKIEVIYNGIQPLPKASAEELKELRVSLQIPEHHMILGTVARLDPIKNQKMMIDAFNEVLKEQPDTTLIIVGDGELMDALQAQVSELGIRDKVIFTGYVTKPGTHIQLFDIFLLSSLSEGTSMTLLEAMSVGVPCVVTDAGGNAEVVEDGVSGVVVKSGFAPEFTSCLLKVLGEKPYFRAMGKNSESRFDTIFIVSKMTSRYKIQYECDPPPNNL
jgi:glycosyltransferase involved in cell wall biosynthesis